MANDVNGDICKDWRFVSVRHRLAERNRFLSLSLCLFLHQSKWNSTMIYSLFRWRSIEWHRNEKYLCERFIFLRSSSVDQREWDHHSLNAALSSFSTKRKKNENEEKKKRKMLRFFSWRSRQVKYFSRLRFLSIYSLRSFSFLAFVLHHWLPFHSMKVRSDFHWLTRW